MLFADMDQLTEDAVAARKAGLSYGKYKALQNPVVIEKKSKIGIETDRCVVCGCEFMPTDNRRRKVCGAKCRKILAAQRALENKHKKAAKESAACAVALE